MNINYLGCIAYSHKNKIWPYSDIKSEARYKIKKKTHFEHMLIILVYKTDKISILIEITFQWVR